MRVLLSCLVAVAIFSFRALAGDARVPARASAKDYIVVEVAIYPENGALFDVQPSDFVFGWGRESVGRIARWTSFLGRRNAIP